MIRWEARWAEKTQSDHILLHYGNDVYLERNEE